MRELDKKWKRGRQEQSFVRSICGELVSTGHTRPLVDLVRQLHKRFVLQIYCIRKEINDGRFGTVL